MPADIWNEEEELLNLSDNLSERLEASYKDDRSIDDKDDKDDDDEVPQLREDVDPLDFSPFSSFSNISEDMTFSGHAAP